MAVIIAFREREEVAHALRRVALSRGFVRRYGDEDRINVNACARAILRAEIMRAVDEADANDDGTHARRDDG
jgi:hypothetical protein